MKCVPGKFHEAPVSVFIMILLNLIIYITCKLTCSLFILILHEHVLISSNIIIISMHVELYLYCANF